MHRIVASITSLDEHLEAVRTNPEVYRPLNCPHCGVTGLWGHGCYYRKGERCTGGATRELVPVLRFLCRGCICTCSRLPLFICPRRWYCCWAGSGRGQVLRFASPRPKIEIPQPRSTAHGSPATPRVPRRHVPRHLPG